MSWWNIIKRISPEDITFKEMSEEEAVATFNKDGYFEYQKRRMRYKTLPSDSIFATAPATMFVAFMGEVPIGVIGYAKYKNILLDAGVHIRKEYRGKGLTSILLDKIIKEKGNKTYLVNISNPNIINSYRRKGFIDIDKTKLPREILEELDMAKDLEQVQKFFQNYKMFNMTLRKNFTPLNEMEEWMQVFINSIYEMHGRLDSGAGHNWIAITNIIQMIAYMGEGAEHKEIMKKFGEIVEIIETKYTNGKELKEELNKIIQRRKGELYQ